MKLNGPAVVTLTTLAVAAVLAVRARVEAWLDANEAESQAIAARLAEVGPDDEGSVDLDDAAAESWRKDRLAKLQQITDRPHLRVVAPTRSFSRWELEAARKNGMASLPDRRHAR